MENEIRMTKLASCAGCGAKVGAGTLAKLLKGLPSVYDERLLVGYDTSDDACVYKISDDLVLVETLDFFPPIVDDPFMFGQIAAANAISDIYAMGAEPKLALNIMAVSPQMPDGAVREVLRGGYTKAAEAGVIISGGHTIRDTEPKYGLSVTGFAHPDRIRLNCTPHAGDVLILTKALGTGIISTANKADMVSKETYAKAVAQMAELNRAGSEIAGKYDVHSITDVTGFGLMGHTGEMANGGNVTAVIESANVPLLPEVLSLAEIGILPEGMYRNRNFAEPFSESAPNVTRAMMDVLFDPQTSGGLLLAVAEKDAPALLAELTDKVPHAGRDLRSARRRRKGALPRDEGKPQSLRLPVRRDADLRHDRDLPAEHPVLVGAARVFPRAALSADFRCAPTSPVGKDRKKAARAAHRFGRGHRGELDPPF